LNKARTGVLVGACCASAAAIWCIASPQGSAHAQSSDQQRKSTASSSPSSASAVENPDWARNGCRVCHGDGDFKPIPLETTDVLCLTCHNGQRASAEPHPIGRTFAGPQIRSPTDWPTPGGKLACVTCHDILQGCTHAEGQAVKNSRFLRDHALVGTTEYCARCHVESTHEKWNPHRMNRDGAVWGNACLSCHTELMQGGANALRTGRSNLKAPEPTLCLGCHTSHVEFFEPGHTGVSVTDRMLTHIETQDTTPMPATSSRPSQVLPFGPRRTIVCSTCHNPHERGVFPENNLLALGALGQERGSQRGYGLRFPGSTLCMACHGDGWRDQRAPR